MLPVLLPRVRRANGLLVLTLLLPVVVFVIIGRTVEIQKDIEKRAFGLAGSSSAGAGICEFIQTLCLLMYSRSDNVCLTPHQYTRHPCPSRQEQATKLCFSLSSRIAHLATTINPARPRTLLHPTPPS